MQDVKFSTVAGIRTCWADEGEGRPVVLVHGGGLGYTHAVWSDVSRFLAERGWRSVALDLPGCGESDSPASYDTYSVENFLKAFIFGVCGQPAHLAAHSMNGSHVIELALQSPEALRSATTIGTGRVLPGFAISSRPSGEERTERQPPTLEDVRRSLTTDVFDPSVLTDERVAQVYAMSIGANFEHHGERRAAGGTRRAQEISNTPLSQRLGDSKVPLLAVFGDGDKNNAGILAPRMAEECPTVLVHMVRNCRHLVQWDAPEELATTMDAFYRSIDNGTRQH